MTTDQLRELNFIMRQAARRARKHLHHDPSTNLLDIWKRAIEKMCVTVNDRDLQFRHDISAKELQTLCLNKPWSFERFEDYVNHRP